MNRDGSGMVVQVGECDKQEIKSTNRGQGSHLNHGIEVRAVLTVRSSDLHHV